MFWPFLKSHLQADCISRKEHLRYSAMDIERDLILYEIIRDIILE
jgi:hypothetical protein